MLNKALKATFFIVITSIIVYFFLECFKNENEQKAKKMLDYNSKFLLNIAEEERLNALAMSTLIAHNKALQECISTNELKNCKTILNNHVSTLKEIPLYKNVKIHLHSSTTTSLVRSWDDNMLGDDLSHFRNSLNLVKKDHKPISGIEVGRCGVFTRGVTPIIKDGEFFGSVEVMLDFAHLNEMAKNQGVNLYIIVEDKFKSDCFFDKLSVVKNYILLNEDSVDLNFANMLNQINLDQIYTKLGNNYFYSLKFYDLSDKFIGYFVLHTN